MGLLEAGQPSWKPWQTENSLEKSLKKGAGKISMDSMLEYAGYCWMRSAFTFGEIGLPLGQQRQSSTDRAQASGVWRLAIAGERRLPVVWRGAWHVVNNLTGSSTSRLLGLSCSLSDLI